MERDSVEHGARNRRACWKYFLFFCIYIIFLRIYWVLQRKASLEVVRELKINSYFWEVWHHHNYGRLSRHSRMEHFITTDRSDFNQKYNSRNAGTTLVFDDRPIEQSKKWIRNISMQMDYSNWDLPHRTSLERLDEPWVLQNQC